MIIWFKIGSRAFFDACESIFHYFRGRLERWYFRDRSSCICCCLWSCYQSFFYLRRSRLHARSFLFDTSHSFDLTSVITGAIRYFFWWVERYYFLWWRNGSYVNFKTSVIVEKRVGSNDYLWRCAIKERVFLTFIVLLLIHFSLPFCYLDTFIEPVLSRFKCDLDLSNAFTNLF